MKPKTHPTVNNKEVKKFMNLMNFTKTQRDETTLFLNGRATAWEEKIEKAQEDERLKVARFAKKIMKLNEWALFIGLMIAECGVFDMKELKKDFESSTKEASK